MIPEFFSVAKTVRSGKLATGHLVRSPDRRVVVLLPTRVFSSELIMLENSDFNSSGTRATDSDVVLHHGADVLVVLGTTFVVKVEVYLVLVDGGVEERRQHHRGRRMARVPLRTGGLRRAVVVVVVVVGCRGGAAAAPVAAAPGVARVVVTVCGGL